MSAANHPAERLAAELTTTLDSASGVAARAVAGELRAHIDARFDRLERALAPGGPADLLWSLETTQAQLGGVSDEYVRRLADAGKITRRYQGRRPFFVAESVREYVEGLTDEP